MSTGVYVLYTARRNIPKKSSLRGAIDEVFSNRCTIPAHSNVSPSGLTAFLALPLHVDGRVWLANCAQECSEEVLSAHCD